MNPFGVKTLYLYYRAYNKSKDKFFRGKFKLVIREKEIVSLWIQIDAGIKI